MNTSYRTGQIRISIRGWLILIAAFMVVFFLIQDLINDKAAQLTEEKNRLSAEYASLENQVAQLESEIEYVNTAAGLEQYARAEGMYKSGEVRYSAVTIGVD